MSLSLGYGPDFLVNLAAGLAYDLMKSGAGRLRDLALGDAAERALQVAWDSAFEQALRDVVADLDRNMVDLTAGIFREFVADEQVATMLIDLALVGRTPPLADLALRFDSLEFDRETLPVDFDQVLASLTSALTEALLATAMRADSPLFNRVNVMRLVAVQHLLQQQQETLSSLASQVARLDEQVLSSQPKYTMVFLGPVTGFSVGDGATIHVDSDLKPLLLETLAQINRLAAPEQFAPYSEEDKVAYLKTVIKECDTIQLPYAEEGGSATWPLRQIYVALKADRSSPVERKASHQLFKALVEEERAEGMGMEEAVIYKIARYDPYAARFLVYDPRLREQLLQDKRAEDDRSYNLAEIIRRHRWLVLLGDPGSGKSTLARWLALQLADAVHNRRDIVYVQANHVRPDADAEKQEALGPARLPVLVRLADYASVRWPAPGTDKRLPLRLFLGRHVENLLQPGRHSRAIYALIQDYLAADRVAFILDGLDEITNLTQRQTIKAEIEGLIDDWIPNQQGRSPLAAGCHQAEIEMADSADLGGNQIIVTSRIVGYQLNPLHENLPHFIIQPMDDTAVTGFCYSWAAATGIPDRAAALTEAVLEHPNINVREQMARNPLMLTILAQVFRAAPHEGLPDRRSELYRRASTAVFGQRGRQWGQLAQSVGGNDLVRAMERITGYIAYHLHANREFPASLADRHTVNRWLMVALAKEPALSGQRRPADIAEDLLAAASNLSGFFVARGEGVYGFLHRQFQEYFAALYLGARVQNGVSDDERWQPFLQRLSDPNWREVLLLAIGVWGTVSWKEAQTALQKILDAPDPTAGVLPHNLLLAARALREMERPPADIVERVAAGLIDVYRRDEKNRFAVLEQRVEQAFTALPRQVKRKDPVGSALAKALVETGDTYDSGRFLRLAAAELLISSKWFTPATAEALAKSWQTHVEPVGTILVALQQVYDAHPDFFSPRFLPLRQSLKADFWDYVLGWPHWQAVMRALYLAPWGRMEKQAVVRDSPLSKELLSLLQVDPGNKKKLTRFLQKGWASESGVKKRDAGLVLVYLGDTVMSPELAGRKGEDDPISRAIFTSSALALDHARALNFDRALALALDHARALDFDRALALDRVLALALDHGRALAVDRAVDRALALDLDLARDLTFDFALDFALDRARALAPDPAKTQYHASELIVVMQRVLQRESLSSDLRDNLAQILAKAKLIQSVLTGLSGVVRTWEAVVRVLQGEEQDFKTWLQDERPVLDVQRVLDLAEGAGLEQILAAGALPRLNGSSLKRLDKVAVTTAREALSSWLAAEETPLLQRHGALLLAEMNFVTATSVPYLLDCLDDAQDLTRFRAQRVLQTVFNQPASTIGRESIEALARWKNDDITATVVTSTIKPWALWGIVHDQPAWLVEWAHDGNSEILGHLGHLDKDWDGYLDLLATSPPEVQELLLDSAARLLVTTVELPTEFVGQLLEMCRSEVPVVQKAALLAISDWPGWGETDRILAELLSLHAAPDLAGKPPEIYTAVAHLASHTWGTELAEKSEVLLRKALPDETALAGIVRLFFRGAEGKPTLPDLWQFVQAQKPRAVVKSSTLLAALLQAGADGFWWDAAYRNLVALIRELVQEDEGQLAALLIALQDALAGSAWSPREIALAAVSACAEVMPDALNLVWQRQALEDLLIRGTEDADSYNSRRFGITALSHLRLLSPDILKVLLKACRDVALVQQDAVAAAGRFQRLSPAFLQEDALAPLAEALHGESGAEAFVAAQLLASLGSSAAVVEIAGLRERIAGMLSEALRHPRAKEMVYLQQEDPFNEELSIVPQGTRAQVLLDALLQVWGMPE